MNKFSMRLLSAEEQAKILPLLGKCFPDYWEQIASECGKMPFEEISFAAFDGDRPVGHCGIIPYTIWCEGNLSRMAGIASVATDPDYRKMGIAVNLCRFAAQWAQENGFASLPLYTGFFRVYEAANWRKMDVPETVSVKVSAPPVLWRHGSELTSAEKTQIIDIYNNSENFNGKVLRQDSGTLHSWARVFGEPGFTFAKIPDAYAIKADSAVIELGFADVMPLAARKDFFASLAENGSVECLLAPTAANTQIISGFSQEKSTIDAMHGERPMVLDLGSGNFHTRYTIFFPVADKF